MENNPQSSANHIPSSAARAGRYCPTCQICGLKHWPKDPMCLGKKNSKNNKNKNKSKYLARLKEESQVVADKGFMPPAGSEVRVQQHAVEFAKPQKPDIDNLPNNSKYVDKVVKIKANSPGEVVTFNEEMKRIRQQADEVVKNASESSKKQIMAERNERIEAEQKLLQEQKLRQKTENKLASEVKRLLDLHEESQKKIETYAAQMEALKSQIAEKNAQKSSEIAKNASEMVRKLSVGSKAHLKLPGDTSSFRIVQSSRASNVGSLLAIRARDIMEENIVLAKPDNTIAELLEKMFESDSHYALICNDGKAEGILSRADLTGRMCEYLEPFADRWRQGEYDAAFDVEIKWIMSKQINAVAPETSCTGIMKIMRKLNMCPLPVVDAYGKPLGIVTPFNVFKIRALLKLESQNSVPIKEKKITGKNNLTPASR